MRSSGFGSAAHLVERFLGSLSQRPPVAAEVMWARQFLSCPERLLFDRMSAPDQRHAIEVARRVGNSLAPDDASSASSRGARPVMAAALLHDVGKVEAHLGTFSRVVVTLLALVAGRDRVRAWSDRAFPGGHSLGRVADYLIHDQIGSELLSAAGSHPMVIRWAAEHHRRPESWGLDRTMGELLKAADGD